MTTLVQHQAIIKRQPEIAHRGIRMDSSVKEVHALMRRMLFEFGFYGQSFLLIVKSRVRANGGSKPHVRLRHFDPAGLDVTVQHDTSNDSRYDCRLSKAGMKAEELHGLLSRHMKNGIYEPVHAAGPAKEPTPGPIDEQRAALSKAPQAAIEPAPAVSSPSPIGPAPAAAAPIDMQALEATCKKLVGDVSMLEQAEEKLAELDERNDACMSRIAELETELSQKRQEMEAIAAKAAQLRLLTGDAELLLAREKLKSLKALFTTLAAS